MEKGPSTWGEYWTSEFAEEQHFDDHGNDMGFETVEEYSQAAKNFAKSKEKEIKEFKAKNGSTYRYNPNTNKFLIISKGGKIVTYFEPTNGQKYFDGEFIKWGDYWIS